MAAIGSPRLVGRREELLRLEQAVAETRAGAGRIVEIVGEAGIGKSRLLGEVEQKARALGHRVLVGGCVSLRDNAAPLAPIVEAMRGFLLQASRTDLDELTEPSRAALAGLLPGSVSAAALQSTPKLMYEQAQHWLHDQIVDLLLRLSRKAATVLVIEDIHWADEATLELLSLLGRNIREAPFALIVSYRSDESDPESRLTRFLAELERLAHPMRVELRRFTRGEVSDQVAAIRGLGTSAALTEVVYARSEGNPFYVEELLATGDAPDLLPATLHDVLEARLTTLSQPARRVVAAAAVRGGEITDAELGALTGLSTARLSKALHELLDRRIFERRGAGLREALDFRHALLREAAYQDLLPLERRELHLAEARYLEGAAGTVGDPFALAELARHWEAAGEVERAFKISLEAGRAADEGYQPALADEQYERAIRLAPDVSPATFDPQSGMVDLLERAGRAAVGAGSDRSIEHLLRAIELVDPAAEAIRAGLLYERMGRYRWYLADGEGALEAYREAVRLVPAQPLSASARTSDSRSRPDADDPGALWRIGGVL